MCLYQSNKPGECVRQFTRNLGQAGDGYHKYCAVFCSRDYYPVIINYM